ncbi:MAG: phosphoribosylformylglycinamidine synthase subunit PurL, partial [Chloroflexi bacterium]
LNNEYVDKEGRRTPIPGTLLISAVAIAPDIRQAVTMDLKAAGNRLYVVGQTRNELGGSLLGRHFGLSGGVPPTLPDDAPRAARALHRAIRRGTVRACHDCSEGGLAVAAAEMALAGGLGLEIQLDAVPVAAGADHPLITLFSESNSRWLVEVEPAQAAAFETEMAGCTIAQIGRVTAEPLLRAGAIQIPVDALEQAWRGGQRGQQ